MVTSQESGFNIERTPPSRRVGIRGRVISIVIFAGVAGAFGLLNWGERTGNIPWNRILNPCGFKQRTHLPCPTCGMTTAVRAFAAGRFVDSFFIQPAAWVLCMTAAAVGLISLVIALTGRDFGVLSQVKKFRFRDIVLTGAIILLGAWLVTLVRAIR